MLRKKAREAIQRHAAALPADADPTTATMYFHAQMELAKFLYKDAADDLRAGKLAEAAAKYKQMGKFVEQHYQTFTKSTDQVRGQDTKTRLDTLMTVLAEVQQARAGRRRVSPGQLRQGAVRRARRPACSRRSRSWPRRKGTIRIKDHLVTGEIVGLALRANMQKGDMEAAKQIFDILDRLSPEDEGGLQVGQLQHDGSAWSPTSSCRSSELKQREERRQAQGARSRTSPSSSTTSPPRS